MILKAVYGRWKDLQSLFIPTSKQLKNEFYTTIAHENLIRVLFVSLFYLLFELYLTMTVPKPLETQLRIVSTFILYFHMVAIVFSLYFIKCKQ